MKRRQVLRAVMTGGVVLVVATSCASATSDNGYGAVPGKTNSSPALPPLGQSQALTEAATKVEGLAASGYGDYYSGVEVTPAGLIVYRKTGGGLDAAVRTALPSVQITFRDAPYSRKELTAVADRILSDRDYWTSQGVPLWTVSARHDGTGVEVGTSAGDKLLAGAPARYGPVRVIVVSMTAAPSVMPLNP